MLALLAIVAFALIAGFILLIACAMLSSQISSMEGDNIPEEFLAKYHEQDSSTF